MNTNHSNSAKGKNTNIWKSINEKDSIHKKRMHIPHTSEYKTYRTSRNTKERNETINYSETEIQEKSQELLSKNTYSEVVSSPRHQKKPRKRKNIFVELFQLSLVVFLIFGVLEGVINAPVIIQYAKVYLNPEAVEEKRIALEETVQNKKFAPILPTAGMTREDKKTYPPLNMGVTPLENRIVIPKIGKNIPIINIPTESLEQANWNKLEKDIQDGLRDGVVHYPGTAEPGQNGNVFITGHSSYYLWDPGKYKDVFARLHDLHEGDEFTLFWDQKIHHYKIRERKVVNPEETDVLDQPKDESIVTLMTCTPIGTTINRLILVAEEIE